MSNFTISNRFKRLAMRLFVTLCPSFFTNALSFLTSQKTSFSTPLTPYGDPHQPNSLMLHLLKVRLRAYPLNFRR